MNVSTPKPYDKHTERVEIQKIKSPVSKRILLGISIAATAIALALTKKKPSISHNTETTDQSTNKTQEHNDTRIRVKVTTDSESVSGTVEEQVEKQCTKIDFDLIIKIDRKSNFVDSGTTMNSLKEHFNSVLERLEKELSTVDYTKSDDGSLQDLLARKTAIEYIIKNFEYTENNCTYGSLKFRLPDGKISTAYSLEEDFEKCVTVLKKNGILDIYDLKEKQLDSDLIMSEYKDKIHSKRESELEMLLNPVERLRGSGYFDNDPHLSRTNPQFYRIISPAELKNLLKTKGTTTRITSNGHHTNGYYSCITANPNYNEQAFIANGLPIRLKLKTKNTDGTFNMSLFNRIGSIKPERSIYKVCGYNYDDIDWSNVCIQYNGNWVALPLEQIMNII